MLALLHAWAVSAALMQPVSPTPAYRFPAGSPGPRLVRHVPPDYPESAMRAGFAGSVILSAEVDAEGRVLDARVAQGIPLLTKPAIDAVRLWRYEPFLMNGAAVPFILTVRIDFSAVAMPAGIDAGLLADLVKGEDAQDSRDAVDFIANRAHRIKRADRAKLVKALDVLLASDPSPTVEEAATRARERLSETR